MALHVPKAPGFSSMMKDGSKFFSGLEEAVIRNIGKGNFNFTHGTPVLNYFFKNLNSEFITFNKMTRTGHTLATLIFQFNFLTDT